jgi:hypothetical protein
VRTAKPRLLLQLVPLVAIALGPPASVVGAALPAKAPAARTEKGLADGESPDFLVVAEDDPWALAVAAPVAAHARRDGRVPLVIAITNTPTREAERLVTLAAPRHALVFNSARPFKRSVAFQDLRAQVLPTGSTPAQDSLLVARQFWTQSRQAVAAAVEDPEAVILGGALAAGLDVPLLVWDRAQTKAAAWDALHALKVEGLLVAASDPKRPPAWAEKWRPTPRGTGVPGSAVDGDRSQASFPCKIQVLGPAELQSRLIGAIGPHNVRNIVMARVPDAKGATGRTAWLAAYVSAARRAPVVLAHSSIAAVAEADVQKVIERHQLRPRNITVLADYGAIGQNLVELELDESRPAAKDAAAKPETEPGNHGQAGNPSNTDNRQAGGPIQVNPPPAGSVPPTRQMVRTEPCVPRDPRKLAEYGVGRIPLESLADTSVLFARGLLRERLLAARPPRLLMIANAGIQRRPLPLCEAISRATAEEFKNAGVPVDEFYGKLANSPEILKAAKDATMVFYEGHLGYQDLVEVPRPGHNQAPDTTFEEELDELEGAAPGQAVDEQPAPRPVRRPAVAIPTKPPRLQGPLTGLPIFVMQSCESLEEPLLWRIDELGGVAVIGSVTPIHSGSGSILVKAASDLMLYGGDETLGEALRDAQNYLLCLEDLKARRGSKEQGKGRRVALSFKLWGDPELRTFPAAMAVPRQQPVTAEWTAGNRLTIRLPQHRLPEVRSDKYAMHIFPGSEAAGIVKQRGGETMRQIAPVYYVRVPLPRGFSIADGWTVESARADSDRASARIGPTGRLLYVVYYPEQEKAGESLVLRLKSGSAGERRGQATRAEQPPRTQQKETRTLRATGVPAALGRDGS